MNKQYYHLSSGGATRWYGGHLADEVPLRVLESAWRGQKIPSDPVQIVPNTGHAPSDFIWVGLCPIVHERVVKLLVNELLNGWDLYPVRVLAASREPLSGYHGLAIIGRCDSIEVDKENVVFLQSRTGRQSPHFQGLRFNEETWDGSDLFRPRDGRTDFVLATSKVHDAFVWFGVKNANLTLIEEYRTLKWTPSVR